MTLVAIVAGKGSPGATTTAAALAASAVADGDVPLLVEFDPAGGTLALDTQLSLDPGLLSLAAAARRGLDPGLVEFHSQPLANGARVLLAPTSPNRARTAMSALAGELTSAIRQRSGVAVVDCGRWDGDAAVAEVLAAADAVLVVVRPTVAGTEQVRTRLASLLGLTSRVEVVCVGERPYAPADVASAVGGLAAPSLANDTRTAELVRAGAPVDRWLRRTALLRSARQLLDHLVADQQVEAPA